MKIYVPELSAMESDQTPVQRKSNLMAGVNRPGRGLNNPPTTSSEI
jgi:hypothetical protein